MNKIKEFYESILTIGFSGILTKTETKRLRILNFSAFFLGVNALVALLIFYLNKELTTVRGVILSIEFFLYCFILYLNSLQKLNLAKTFFTLLALAIMFYHNNFIFKHEYAEYYYLLISIGTLIFFDNKWIHILVLILAIVLFYIPNLFFKVYDQQDYGYFHVIPFFYGMFMGVRYFRNENIKNEKALEQAYAALEEKKKGEVAHLQLKSLKAQMNPHFMFNAMNSIQNLVLKGDKHEAYQYLSKFSSVVRENLNMSEKSFVSFDEEFSLLQKYLELEKLRFRTDFEYELVGADKMEDIYIPAMIIQPFVENAIKHGLLHKIEGNKKLCIEFIQDDVFKCIITDNGVGLEKSKVIKTINDENHTSFSTQAIKNRLELLKDFYKTDIGFEYLPVKNGTKVLVKIPYTLTNE